MVELEMFDVRSAAEVAGWARTPEEAAMWCSLPVVTDEIVAGWSDRAGSEAFVLRDGGKVVAYGEIWVDTDENEVEIAHLIVAPNARGRGLGRRLVEGLVHQARRHYPVVAIRVHSLNEIAIRCYTAAGFRRASPADEAAWNVGQPVEYVWMTHAGA